MSINSVILLFVLISFGLNSAFAGPTCPLSNPRYKSLREAVAALSTKVQLPPGCAAKEAALKEATELLNKSATQFAKLTEDKDAQERFNSGAEAAQQAIQSLNTINSVLVDQCARSLLETSDFVGAFVDTINAITPYIMLFGGPVATPWVLGTVVTGSAIKAVISFFFSNGIDMNKEDQRRAFIENSCGFYTLNETVRSLIQAQKSEETEISRRLIVAKDELSRLKNAEPQKPTTPYAVLEEENKKDQDELDQLKATISRFNDPGFSCFLVRGSIERGFATPAIERLERVLEGDESGKAAKIRFFTEYFRNQLDRSAAYDLHDAQRCSTVVSAWLSGVGSLLAATAERLEYKLEKDPVYVGYRRWKRDVTKKVVEVQDYELRQKFLAELVGSGAVIETSEVISTLSSIRRMLFSSRSWGRRGLAETWLYNKYRESGASLKVLDEQLEALNLLPTALQKKDLSTGRHAALCAQAEQGRNAWFAAETHVNAAMKYCLAFSSTLTRSFDDVRKFCFSGKKSSLPAQAARVAEQEYKARAVDELMKQLECKEPDKIVLP